MQNDVMKGLGQVLMVVPGLKVAASEEMRVELPDGSSARIQINRVRVGEVEKVEVLLTHVEDKGGLFRALMDCGIIKDSDVDDRFVDWVSVSPRWNYATGDCAGNTMLWEKRPKLVDGIWRVDVKGGNAMGYGKCIPGEAWITSRPPYPATQSFNMNWDSIEKRFQYANIDEIGRMYVSTEEPRWGGDRWVYDRGTWMFAGPVPVESLIGVILPVSVRRPAEPTTQLSVPWGVINKAFKYATRSKGGRVEIHTARPKMTSDGGWAGKGQKVELPLVAFSSVVVGNTDWRISLIERNPEE